MKKNLLTIVISAVLALIFVLLLFVFQVRQSEVAVVTLLDKPTAQPYDQPGAYFKWPWPIHKVYKLDQRIQNFEDKLTQSQTADKNSLMTMVYVGWRITDAKTFFPKFAGGSTVVAERMLEDIVSNAKVAVVGKHPLGDFVNASEQDLKFDAIEREIRTITEAQLRTNNCGIGIEYLGFKKLGLPESVTQAVFDQMTSERKVLSDELDSEGLSKAAQIRSTAEREAAETISKADGEARKIKSQGEKIAAEVFPIFQQNPELANFLLRLDALELSLKEHATLIFDMRTPPFDLFSGAITNKSGK
jgi:membrane protease subunit HflC